MAKLIISLIFSIVFFVSHAAAASSITVKLSSGTFSSSTALAVKMSDGTTKTASVASGAKKFTLSGLTAGAKYSLYLRDSSSGEISKMVVLQRCTGKGNTTCTTSKVHTKIKAPKKSLTLKAKVGTQTNLLIAKLTGTNYTAAVKKSEYVTASTISASLSTNGRSTTSTSAKVLRRRAGRIFATNEDEDADGLPDAIDADNDGDDVIDNYDTDSNDQAGTDASSTTFRVFSNFKLNIDDSNNFNTDAFNASLIDTLLQNTQSLAIQVAGGTVDATELDCGSLAYCSAGGTGTSNNSSFPGSAGGAFDSDSDGLGTIAIGSTGDFQLQTHATSTQITAGDTLIERVTDSSNAEKIYTGSLNFVFQTNPAVKSVAVSGGATTTIDYTQTSNRAGSSNNCISVPSSGDVILTIVGWRPQRPGDSTLGESQYVDIGKSLITIDIPNPPCTGLGCSGSGPGNCAAASYSTSDSNLTVGSDGLEDGFADADASSSNTYTFTLNLTQCLNLAPSGAISWSAGQKVFLDLQFRSQYGDNAAEKFCVQRG